MILIGVEEVALARSDTLYESLRFVTYNILDILEYLSMKIQIN